MKHTRYLLELRYHDIYWGVSMYCAQADIVFENIFYWASLKPEVVLNSADKLIQKEKKKVSPHTIAWTHTYILQLSMLFVANSNIYSITFGHFNVYLGLSPSKKTEKGKDLLVTFWNTLPVLSGVVLHFQAVVNMTRICSSHPSFLSICLVCAYHLQYVSAQAKTWNLVG